MTEQERYVRSLETQVELLSMQKDELQAGLYVALMHLNRAKSDQFMMIQSTPIKDELYDRLKAIAESTQVTGLCNKKIAELYLL